MVPITFIVCGEISMATGGKTYWRNTIGTPRTIGTQMSAQASNKSRTNCDGQKTEGRETAAKTLLVKLVPVLDRTASTHVVKVLTGWPVLAFASGYTPDQFAGILSVRT
jgi:hypothetical protein